MYAKAKNRRSKKSSYAKTSSKRISRRKGKSTFITTRAREIAKTSKSVQRTSDILPRNWFVQFKYVESSYITPLAASGLSSIGYTYAGNNVYDPRVEAGGNQPLYYDQIAPYYERMWVHGCKVELTFSNPTVDGLYVGYRVRPQTNSVTTAGQTLDYIQELDLTEIKPLNNSGNQTVKFTFYFKNHKVFGITKSQFQDLTYSHTNSADPPVETYITPFAISTTSDASVRYDIKIIYYTEMTNRISVPEST